MQHLLILMMIYSLILCDGWSSSHRSSTQTHPTQSAGPETGTELGSSERECGICLETKEGFPKERTFGPGFEASIGVCQVEK